MHAWLQMVMMGSFTSAQVSLFTLSSSMEQMRFNLCTVGIKAKLLCSAAQQSFVDYEYACSYHAMFPLTVV